MSIRRTRAFVPIAGFLGALVASACRPAPPPTTEPPGQICTRDAKLCPDGSAVGASAPDRGAIGAQLGVARADLPGRLGGRRWRGPACAGHECSEE
ncbi:MAG: hypothetical protein IAG13_23170, partial [Deltaproteobacteria bacterium]|nr:hypothetical protein [Nannocystaceae bacterium]